MRSPINAQFSATGGSIPEARQMVRSALGSWGVGGVTLDDLVLAASELVTNAVAYGSGDVIDVRVADIGRSIELRVLNALPPETSVVTDRPMPAPDARSGRGLALVRLLADRIETTTVDGSFAVSMYRHWP